MKVLIDEKLADIEQKHGVKILFACESGSRAWGFPSTDSDYDVRFIYVRPLERYLSIAKSDDVIEVEDMVTDLDMSGWDLAKTLKLIYKSNAVIWEWLQSPIVYRNDDKFKERLLSVAAPYFAPRASFHHYASLVARMLDDDMDATEIKIKRYFYILRPILAAWWVCSKKTVPPMVLTRLLSMLSAESKERKAIEKLVQQKADALEGDKLHRIIILEEMISRLRAEFEKCAADLQDAKGEITALDIFFRSIVMANGGSVSP